MNFAKSTLINLIPKTAASQHLHKIHFKIYSKFIPKFIPKFIQNLFKIHFKIHLYYKSIYNYKTDDSDYRPVAKL